MPDITITWGGIDYRVREDSAFELIEAIERHITLPDLLGMIGSGRPNFSALARPFHEMLTHAGVRNVPTLLELRRMLVADGMANLKHQAEREALMREGKSVAHMPESITGNAMAAIGAMIHILMDGAPDMGGEEASKKKQPRSRKAATKSRSGNGASRRASSGA